MERKDRIDLLGATLLTSFSFLMGLNQVLVKLVNAGLAPAFQAGLRSAFAVVPASLRVAFRWYGPVAPTITMDSILVNSATAT